MSIQYEQQYEQQHDSHRDYHRDSSTIRLDNRTHHRDIDTGTQIISPDYREAS